MAEVKVGTKVPVSAEMLWRTIGAFNALDSWHPAVIKSETQGRGRGSTRTLRLVDGGFIVERLDASDSVRRSYRCSVLSGPLPVADCVSELHIGDNGDGTSTVQWSSRFEPLGASEHEAVAAVQGVHQAGLDNLNRMFGD